MGKERTIPMVVAELEEETIHLLVEAEIAGLENYWWVVDTGASKSVIGKDVACRIVDKESAGSMATGLGKEMVETSTGVIADFRLGGYSFEALTVAIVDLDHVNQEYAKYSDKRIAGLLGSDFFYREKAVIDYEQRAILL
jgi:hypothetical protein